MNLQLKQLRNDRGLSQEAMAKKLTELMGEEVKISRYGTWERGDRMMSLEQAYYCAVALGCTLNDLVGMKSDGIATRDERQLVESYRRMDETNRASMLDMASSLSVAAQLKKEGHGRAVAMVGDDVKDSK